ASILCGSGSPSAVCVAGSICRNVAISLIPQLFFLSPSLNAGNSRIRQSARIPHADVVSFVDPTTV
ncbi:MAG: hypothetical protein WAT77_15070, partial [Paracoccaceae bacterium]